MKNCSNSSVSISPAPCRTISATIFPMERTVKWDDWEIVYSVKRSRRRRTVALRVEPSGAITVYAPTFVWGPLIDSFVRKQKEWIFKKLAYFKDRPLRGLSLLSCAHCSSRKQRLGYPP